MLKVEKQELVKALKNELSDVDGFVFCTFEGLDVPSFTKLREDIHQAGGVAKVVKNRLLKNCLADTDYKDLESYLTGMNVLIYSKEDVLASLKVTGNFLKEHEDLSMKGGMIKGSLQDNKEMLTIAKLPGYKELIAMTVGGLVNVLSVFNGTLEALANKKEEMAKE